MSTVQVGEKIPEFSAATHLGDINSSEFSGKQVVIYFYPKDNTPGCTTEGQDFRDSFSAFEAANTMIIGVSRDSLRTHENFAKKHEFPFALLSDPDEKICRLFDVIKLKKLYGKEHEGIERSTFLFDNNGILQKEWRKVKVKGHVEEVLEAAKSIQS
ncbi:peroxiredoxin [Pokkaliibacter sp. CJK22405]|uniref:peroxiredoxin n=1 Tax=Pokkaliibacter sp. CJK22405 TaxID=3384615 RepID=UPI00398549D6